MAGPVNLKIDSFGASSIDEYLEYKRQVYFINPMQNMHLIIGRSLPTLDEKIPDSSGILFWFLSTQMCFAINF